MSMASEKVFMLPELLERVLVGLSLEELFVFQRVNSTFRDTIRRSKDAQITMRLAPSDTCESCGATRISYGGGPSSEQSCHCD